MIGALSLPATASPLALDMVSLTGNDGTNEPQSLGWLFQVLSPIVVDGLAFYDHVMTASHEVGIFDNGSQALLISATVSMGDPLAGTAPWRVHAITPFALGPGLYVVAAETFEDNYTFDPTSMSTIPEIVFVEDRFAFHSPTLVYPTDVAKVQGWFGPSFTATPATTEVPEPVTTVLFGVGMATLARARKRLRR